MSENASATELTSQYTAQVSADLERNTKEQERIGGEIAALQEQLAALQSDHKVLVNIQRALDTAPASAEPVAPSDSVPVPAPRKKSAAKTGPATRTRTKKTAAKSRPAAAAKPTAKKPTPEKPAPEKPADTAEAAKTTSPTLVELVRRHLAEQSEPRSAAEIATTLGQTHPDRNIKTTVVRTTVEGLVARNQAQRSKQGASVYYTAPDAQAASPQAEEQPAPVDA
ncbi:hypothetical protein [Streptomyces sp. NBC_01373]|uniref:hypothetical protein n=1 Tax=Streptomyces sp. NBC_01373 TaxID=2903843 RepID=UPI0022595E2D|nr:hypothetical protein [Streptomyces sp. NBC_01373]MCX4706378.1 hypothetical protein [Streptomyces sp. NBC_01373]